MAYRSLYEVLTEEERHAAVEVLDADGRMLLVMPERDARAQGLAFEAVAFVLVDRRGRCLAALDADGRVDFLGGRAVHPDESCDDAVADAAGRLARGAFATRRRAPCRPWKEAGGCWVVPYAIEVAIAAMDAAMETDLAGVPAPGGRSGLVLRSTDWMRVRALAVLRPADMGLAEGAREAPDDAEIAGMTMQLAVAIARGLLEKDVDSVR